MTHGISFLPKVDQIVCLVDGKISEVGTFKQLMDHAGAFAEFIHNYLMTEDEETLDELDEDGEWHPNSVKYQILN